jgi:hypothetical protein
VHARIEAHGGVELLLRGVGNELESWTMMCCSVDVTSAGRLSMNLAGRDEAIKEGEPDRGRGGSVPAREPDGGRGGSVPARGTGSATAGSSSSDAVCLHRHGETSRTLGGAAAVTGGPLESMSFFSFNRGCSLTTINWVGAMDSCGIESKGIVTDESIK